MRHSVGTACPGRAPDRRRRKARGQSLVEFALLAPVLIFIFAGAADLGRALTAYIELGSAAREGAAYGSQNHETVLLRDEIEAAARAAAPDIWGEPANARVTDFCSVILANNRCPGDPGGTDHSTGYSYVEVTASYTFDPIFPGIPGFTMQRVATMRVIN